MKVVLLSDVYKHGVAGEVISVADGFARNWLIPQKLAAKATAQQLEQLEELRSQAAARKAALEGRLNDLARQIDGTELFFGRRASPTGKLFGSVTTTEIADALNTATGIDINRRRISQIPLRELGTHEVPIRLGSEISPMLKVTIVREEEFARFMADRERAAAAGEGAAEVSAEAPAEAEANVEAIVDENIVEDVLTEEVVVEETVVEETVAEVAASAEVADAADGDSEADA